MLPITLAALLLQPRIQISADPAVPKQAADDFAKMWDTVSSGIRRTYYAAKAREADMNRLFDKYKPIASAAKSRNEFTKAINDMIAEFKDSHFALYNTDDQGFYVMDSLARQANATPMPNIGAYFRPGPDGYTVGMVLNSGEAEKADIRKGDLVLAANGQPFQPVNSFNGNDPVRLSISRNGQKLEKTVKPTKQLALDMFLDATRKSVRVISDRGHKIGYMHVWTLASEGFKSAVSGAVLNNPEVSKTDAFILDLRDGFGGRPEGFADPFFRPDATLAWKYPTFTNSESFGYARPLIVLINGGSRSAKEVLSQILKDSHRAVLVGSTTAGNVLGTFPTSVSSWAYLEVPMVDLSVNGKRLEAVGCSPDVAVPQEFDAEGHDLYIAKALELFKDVKPYTPAK